MLTIRPEQVEILAKGCRVRFRQRAEAHLRRFFPAECEALGSEELTRRIAGWIERARVLGITSERHLLYFLSLGMEMGENFHDLPWVREYLSDTTVPIPGDRVVRAVAKRLRDKEIEESNRRIRESFRDAG